MFNINMTRKEIMSKMNDFYHYTRELNMHGFYLFYTIKPDDIMYYLIPNSTALKLKNKNLNVY